MIRKPNNLPDDIETLKQFIASYEAENKLLREQNRLLRARLFGRKTEKILPEDAHEQLLLFNEAEESLSEEPPKPEDEIVVPEHKRRKRGRKPLPPELPRVDAIHDLSEEEKICSCGAVKVKIGEEVSEQLDIIPAKIQVIRNIRYKYACKCCEGTEDDGPTVVTAPMPKQLIPKSMATAGLVAYILTSKFVDALPFYRQEKQFTRIGIEIHRSTMCGWAIKAAQRCMPLIELLHSDMLSGPLINCDETPVQVMNEPDRANTTKSYMWVFRGGDPIHPIVLYRYHPTRSGDVPAEFLRGYEGYVQTDGYIGYNFLDQQQGITHVGCWAHARRNFNDVIKAAGKRKSGKTGSADVAMAFIGKLYRIEKNARLQQLSPLEIYELRQEKSKPILDKFKKWLDKKSVHTPPNGLLGKAVQYALNQWHRLTGYLKDGRVSMDNNLAENAIRPFVIGRKNWLFSGKPVGAEASACLYSLIETAKANGIEPYRYLRYVFDNIPKTTSTEDYRALLPQHIDRTRLASLE